MATSERMKNHSTDLKRANQKIHGLKKELKQARVDLTTLEQTANHARNSLQELGEIKKVASRETF